MFESKTMKPKTFFLLIFFIAALLSCSSPRYINDSSSHERQKELRASRSGGVVIDVLLTIGSLIFSSATESDAIYFPQGQRFKRFKLINTATDTMYVNMLTDATWDNEDYCDFMDIRIPPEKRCKILVPIGVTYNIYFGVTNDPEKDELLEVNTHEARKVALTPGMTQGDWGE